MKLPKLQQLKYLVALHDTGHFGQAAKKCFVSQSTLSSAIQALEEQLDSQLVERDHKTFVFTALGQDVVLKARKIIELSSDLVATSTSNGDEFVGELHVGIIPTIAPFVLSELIRHSSKTYPNLKLFLREDTSENSLALLRSGQLDMVLLATPYDTTEFVELTLARDPFFKVSHPDNTNGQIYLLESEHCLSDHAISGCHLTDNSHIHPFQASSLNSLLAMVEGHKGETYLPKLAINSGVLNHSELVSEPLRYENAARNLSLVWRKTSQRREFYVAVSSMFKAVVDNKLL
ncbi:hydrogen peroxide-inducible genes activator [Psychrosphaera aestuarii]|uniref:hydrogen peroxide-inducible genes activator n=1 Tax=Psychrosphaera aestuarii TaxID=1266052 RepID=UPI001B3311A5|nr:hydrogen peroxide-inducible genes activator [Psychrosphaera aestuarii]